MAVDFSELKAFRDKLQQIGRQGAPQLCKDCTRELASRLLAKVIKRTPTGDYSETYELEDDGEHKYLVLSDMKGGTLKRGWTAGRDVDAFQYIASQPVNVLNMEYKINLINQVEYAAYVEYGHRQTPGRYVPAIGKRLKQSWVPGVFMLQDSLAELDAKAQSIVDRKVEQYLEKELT